MKNSSTYHLPSLLAGLVLAGGLTQAFAVDRIKADNADVLTVPTSWTNNIVPTANDVGYWDGATAATNAWVLGASTNWQGIKSAMTSGIFINADGSTLGLGTAGVDLSAANGDLGLRCNVQLTAPQTWNVNTRTINLSGNLTNNGNLLTVQGSGVGGTLSLDTTNAAVITGNLQLTNGAILNILKSNLTLLGNVRCLTDTNTVIRQGSSGTPYAANVVTLADGINDWNYFAIAGKTNTLTFKASANSTNLFKKFNVSGQGTVAIASGADGSTMVLDGGYYRITGNVFDANGTTAGAKFVLTNGVKVNCDHIRGDGSWGGARDFRGSLEVASNSLFAAHFMGIMMYGADGQSFVVNKSGSVTVDHSLGTLDNTTGTGTNTFRGIEIGGQNNGQANATTGGVSMKGGQTNGLVRVSSARTFRAFALGNNMANKTNTYVISGPNALMELYGTRADLVIGAETNGNGLATFTMLDNAKVVVEGNVRGGQLGGLAQQVFDLQSGTLVAGGIDAKDLRAPGDVANGTFKNNGGTLAPGDLNRPGRTTVYGDILLAAGKLDIDLGGTTAATDFTNAPGYYDVLQATTNATVGGDLIVRLIDSFTPTSNDVFTVVFVNSSGGGIVSGTFNNLLPGSGLGRVAVANQPGATFLVTTNVSGTAIQLSDYDAGVVAPPPQPTITSVKVSGSNLILQGTNNAGNGGQYYILSSTNVATAYTNWTPVLTNTFVGGLFSNNIPVTAGEPKRFYLLQAF